MSGGVGDIPVDGVGTEGVAVYAVDDGRGDKNSLSSSMGDIPVNRVIMEGVAVET